MSTSLTNSQLWLCNSAASSIRLRPQRPNHVLAYDFLHHPIHDGRAFRTLNVLDEFTRESLAIRVRRKFGYQILAYRNRAPQSRQQLRWFIVIGAVGADFNDTIITKEEGNEVSAVGSDADIFPTN